MTRQRAADVRDIKKKCCPFCSGIQTVDLSNLPKDTVLVAEELTPSMTRLYRQIQCGRICDRGGFKNPCGHSCKGNGNSAVLSLKNACEVIKSGQLTVVDGVKGEVITEPSNDVTAEYIRLRVDFDKERRRSKVRGQGNGNRRRTKGNAFCQHRNPRRRP